MSRLISVFVDSAEQPQEFAASVEAILGYPLEDKPVPDAPDLLYRFTDHKHRWFDIYIHRLINDREFNFEDYRYQIEIGVFNIPNFSDWTRALYDFGEELFGKLKKSNKYNLMMVEDVDRMLGEFSPAHKG